MASHFKQPDEEGDRAARHASRRSDERARRAGWHVRTRRGGDESYHAPSSNPHAAGIAHSADASYIPAVGGEASDRRGRSKRNSHFVETDPYDLSGRRSRDPRKRAARIISVALFVVGIGLMVTAAGMWIYNQWQYGEQDRVIAEMATYADVSDDGTTPPQVDWAGLKAVNNEVVGWLQIPGTVVNFPVYQASDNDKYLRQSPEGDYAIGGTVFMDYANTPPGMIDSQTILYGHHMFNGTMFKTISDMANQEMFDSVSTVWYVTEDATYELEPLLVYETESDDQEARQFTFASEDELHVYLQGLLDRAVAKRSDAAEVISRTSRVLTLCTCNYDYGDSGRTLLVCVPKADAADSTNAAATDAVASSDAAQPAETNE